MKKALSLSALSALLLAGCAGMNQARTLQPGYAHSPGKGVVIGLFDATQMGVPDNEPTLFIKVKSEKGAVYKVEAAEAGSLTSAFYVALPAGKYKFIDGTAGGGRSNARTIMTYDASSVYFEVKDGAVTCIGGVMSQPTEGALQAIQKVASNAYKGKFAVEDKCDEVGQKFAASYAGLGDVQKALAEVKEPK